MFGAYDYNNDKIHVHCYKKKTGKQFIDFLKRVEKRYDKNILKISLLFLITYGSINQRRYKKKYQNIVQE